VRSGLYVVDKPGGMTSHTVVAKVRRALGTRAVGHAGTLDPMATGVLLVLVGEAKKLSGYLTLEQKSYRARVHFGRSTNTLDADGETVETGAIPGGALAVDAVQAALDVERRRTLQVPPAVSAIKVAGVRAHRLARRGTPPDLEPRPVTVSSLTLIELEAEHLTVEVTASKGYYVRSLARDLGAALGTPAHLSSLRRTRSGDYSIDQAVTIPSVDTATPFSLIEIARTCLPIVELTEAGAARARLGQLLSVEHFAGGEPSEKGPSAWVFPAPTLIAVGERRDDGYRVIRGFRDDDTPDADADADADDA